MTEKQEAAVRALVEASQPEGVGYPVGNHQHGEMRLAALRLACGDNCTSTDGNDTLALARAYAHFLIEGR